MVFFTRAGFPLIAIHPIFSPGNASILEKPLSVSTKGAFVPAGLGNVWSVKRNGLKTSSEIMARFFFAAMSPSAATSSTVATAPVGLWGEISTMAFVLGVMEEARCSRLISQRMFSSRRYGTSFTPQRARRSNQKGIRRCRAKNLVSGIGQNFKSVPIGNTRAGREKHLFGRNFEAFARVIAADGLARDHLAEGIGLDSVLLRRSPVAMASVRIFGGKKIPWAFTFPETRSVIFWPR